MPTKRFILVGHCGADAGSLRHAIRSAAPDAIVGAASSDRDLASLGPDCVLLVNRVLDGHFTAGDGIEFIQQCGQKQPSPVCVLISNYAEAQDEAVAAGAVRGFGKSELGSRNTIELLRSLAAEGAPADK